MKTSKKKTEKGKLKKITGGDDKGHRKHMEHITDSGKLEPRLLDPNQ